MRSLSRDWFRGRARREGEMIVLDRLERYDPESEPRIGLELSRVRTPEDAVSFAGRFGLPDMQGTVEGKGGDGMPCLMEARYPFADFERAASELREALRLIVDTRKAADGNADALRRLRKQFGPANPDGNTTIIDASGTRTVPSRAVLPPQDFEPVDDRTVMIRATDHAALIINDGLLQADARPYVFDPAYLYSRAAVPGRPGRLKIGILPETLLGFCYLTIAQAAAHEPLERCPECQRIYVVEDGRQKYCTPACASRARFRKFKNTPKGKARRQPAKPAGRGE